MDGKTWTLDIQPHIDGQTDGHRRMDGLRQMDAN